MSRKILEMLADAAVVLGMFGALWGALLIGHGLGLQ